MCACVCVQEEDSLRGITGPDGMLANTARPLAGLGKRTKWLPPENVAYGNMSPAKKETLSVRPVDNACVELTARRFLSIFLSCCAAVAVIRHPKQT